MSGESAACCGSVREQSTQLCGRVPLTIIVLLYPSITQAEKPDFFILSCLSKLYRSSESSEASVFYFLLEQAVFTSVWIKMSTFFSFLGGGGGGGGATKWTNMTKHCQASSEQNVSGWRQWLWPGFGILHCLTTKTKVLLVQEYSTTSEEGGMRVKLFQIKSVTVFSVGSKINTLSPICYSWSYTYVHSNNCIWWFKKKRQKGTDRNKILNTALIAGINVQVQAHDASTGTW